MQHLQLNTTLQGGKYRIQRVLGQGGFGITYLAIEMPSNRSVAIKEFFMKSYCGRDAHSTAILIPSTGNIRQEVNRSMQKFIKEAQTLSSLNHPNIIKVYHVFQENNTAYYVMPYYSKGSLQDLVGKQGPLPEQQAKGYVSQIAGALKYMHGIRICHYDVKPGNILLDGNGNAILIDFGIAKVYNNSGMATTSYPVGITDGYAPLEQYTNNGSFSPVSDVYSLGATLYFLLHGKAPVPAIKRSQGTQLPMNPNLSQQIKALVSSSMAVSARARAQSVDCFINPPTTYTPPNGGYTTVTNPPQGPYPSQGPPYGAIIVGLICFAILALLLVCFFFVNFDGKQPQGSSGGEPQIEMTSSPPPSSPNQVSELERKLQSCSYNTDAIYKGARIHYPNFCSVSHGSPNRYNYGSDFCLKTWYVIHRDACDSYQSLINGQGMQDVYKEQAEGRPGMEQIPTQRIDMMVATVKNPDGSISYIKAAVVPGTLGTDDETVVFAELTYPSNLSSSANAQLIQRIFGSFPN